MQKRVLESLNIRILCPVNLQYIYSNNLSINSIHYVIINIFVDFQRSTLQSVQWWGSLVKLTVL